MKKVKSYGISNDAIMKITGKTAGGNKKKILQVIKQFKNNQYPNIAVTVDLLTTGIDVPSICNLVFMRKINSRILFEQMLGRATRICHEIGKTHFNIFDAVRVYEDLDSTSGMKSVSVSKTMPELLEDLFRNNGENKQQVKDRILARLQRKNNNLTATQKYDIIERLNGVDLKSYIKKLKSYTENTFVKTCVQDKDFLLWVDLLKREKKGYYYSAKPDILRETTRGYGNTEKPEDYLEAFAKFVNENKDKIEAIRIACTKPSDMTRAQDALNSFETRKAAILHKAFTGELTARWRKEHGVRIESWKNVSVSEICHSLKYGTSKKSVSQGKVVVIRMGNLQDGEIRWDDLAYSNDEEDIEKYRLFSGDVLFNRTNSSALVGKTSIYRGDYPAIYAGYRRYRGDGN